jgi:hypothetical protein
MRTGLTDGHVRAGRAWRPTGNPGDGNQRGSLTAGGGIEQEAENLRGVLHRRGNIQPSFCIDNGPFERALSMAPPFRELIYLLRIMAMASHGLVIHFECS